MAPIQAAFAERWPEAETVNLLDDGLSLDRAKEPGEISAGMIDRFVRFGRYGHDMGADGILITCSAFGPAIDRLSETVPVPVLKPKRGDVPRGHRPRAAHRHAGDLRPSIGTMTDEFEDFVGQSGRAATLRTILVDDAMARCAPATPRPTTGSSPSGRRNSPTATRSCWRISRPPGRPRRCAPPSTSRS